MEPALHGLVTRIVHLDAPTVNPPPEIFLRLFMHKWTARHGPQCGANGEHGHAARGNLKCVGCAHRKVSEKVEIKRLCMMALELQRRDMDTMRLGRRCYFRHMLRICLGLSWQCGTHRTRRKRACQHATRHQVHRHGPGRKTADRSVSLRHYISNCPGVSPIQRPAAPASGGRL